MADAGRQGRGGTVGGSRPETWMYGAVSLAVGARGAEVGRLVAILLDAWRRPWPMLPDDEELRLGDSLRTCQDPNRVRPVRRRPGTARRAGIPWLTNRPS
jgi:hypothetical protein